MAGAAIVEKDGGLDGGAMVNIFGMWTRGYDAHWRATGFSLVFIRLASNVL